MSNPYLFKYYFAYKVFSNQTSFNSVFILNFPVFLTWKAVNKSNSQEEETDSAANWTNAMRESIKVWPTDLNPET